MTRRKLLFIFLIFCLSLSLAPAVKAADTSLYLSPSSGSYVLGNSFSIDVRVNSGGVSINASQSTLVFSPSKLEVISISKRGSIFGLWVSEPSFSNSNGTVSFSGGLPNPGYVGASGKIITIIFKAKAAGTATVSFASGAVLANDGKGTNILFSTGKGNYNILTTITSPKPSEVISPSTTLGAPNVFSDTHPDQNAWYSTEDANFRWELESGVTGVSILLNDRPSSNPGPVSDGLFSSKDYEGLGEGVSYLHLKLRKKGSWSEINHYRVQVDLTPPESFKIETKILEGDIPAFYFRTVDALSGMDRYEVKIANQEYVVSEQKATLEIPALPPGGYTAIVKAIDKAENEMVSFKEFIVEPIEPPIIKNYPTQMNSSDQLFISGIALPEVNVEVFIKREGTDKITQQSVSSDGDGNWFLVNEDGFANGRYSAWAIAINKRGLKSGNSNMVRILVTPPVFAKVGNWVINYFVVFIGLLTLFFLLLMLLFFLFWYVRRKLKKEIKDIEKILNKNMEECSRYINNEMESVIHAKRKIDQKKTLIKAQKNVKEKTEAIKKKILKEVRDVEEILE